MSSPRRRIIRATVPTISDSQRQRQIQKLRERLEHERAALGRWQTRLKRAFNTVEKHQKAILRIERQRARLEKP
jgi:hypothetical protein